MDAAVEGVVTSLCKGFLARDLLFCPFRQYLDECCGFVLFFPVCEERQKKIISARNEPAFVLQHSFQASVFVVLVEGTGMCGPWPGTLDVIVTDGNVKWQCPGLSL